MPEVNVAFAETGLVASRTSGTALRRYGPFVLFFTFLWAEAIHHLQGEWSFNPQYSYGWSVPLLVAYLFWRRWPHRPRASAPRHRRFTIALIVCGGLLLLPTRFLAEANPDWRLLSWIIATTAVGISLAFVYLAGGRAWLGFFAFPFLFFLVAVPWPTHFEQSIIQNLMRAVSAINVALVNAIGIPAIQHGNVIEVRTGLIGIEEACSGVRSLQATFMVSLFLGELFSFRTRFRVLLVALGAILAFACNLFRTALLVWIGATRGIHAVEGWHDPAGLSILLICLAALWLIALAIQRFIRQATVKYPSTSERAPALLSFNRSLVLGLAVWLVLVESGVQVWYGFHQSAGAARWNAVWPGTEVGYKSLPIPPAAENLLRYDEGGGASWEGAQSHQWMMFFFRWLPGHTAALFVKIHRPDICLPASGLTMQHDSGIRLLKVNGISLPVRSYRFDAHGTPLHVFYCYWDARSSYESEAAANEEDWTARGRVRAAWRGRREIGAQMLELVVLGYEKDDEADAALQRQLKDIVRSG
jgi:exosortase